MGRLILWDIDGTLIRGGGVGSQALKRAACEVAALADIPRVDPHGKTDPQILREMFQAAQVDPERIDGFVADATIGMERALAELEHELRAKASILPGVVEVLKRIDALADVRQTLLTGNIAANAAIKVAAFGLTEFFDAEVGAYGTDHEDRLELVPIALDRVSAFAASATTRATCGSSATRRWTSRARGPAAFVASSSVPVRTGTTACATCRPTRCWSTSRRSIGSSGS